MVKYVFSLTACGFTVTLVLPTTPTPVVLVRKINVYTVNATYNKTASVKDFKDTPAVKTELSNYFCVVLTTNFQAAPCDSSTGKTLCGCYELCTTYNNLLNRTVLTTQPFNSATIAKDTIEDLVGNIPVPTPFDVVPQIYRNLVCCKCLQRYRREVQNRRKMFRYFRYYRRHDHIAREQHGWSCVWFRHLFKFYALFQWGGLRVRYFIKTATTYKQEKWSEEFGCNENKYIRWMMNDSRLFWMNSLVIFAFSVAKLSPPHMDTSVQPPNVPRLSTTQS